MGQIYSQFVVDELAALVREMRIAFLKESGSPFSRISIWICRLANCRLVIIAKALVLFAFFS